MPPGVMIPFHGCYPGGAEPSAPIYYLVAANGVFLVDRSLLFTSVTPAPRVPGLARADVSLQLSLPRIPRQLLERMYGFFRAVYETWQGEAVAFIYYAPASRTFRLAVPPQTLAHAGHVTYGHLSRPDGFIKLGDAHSHAAFPAFFSGTDDRDDAQDGLRIVLGRVHRRPPDVSVSFVAHATRFLLRPQDILEDFSTPLTPPRKWLERVTCGTEEMDRARANGRACS
ncbi:MAG: Mov34/MPN/PAD-1 family protein [Acidobacteria bacterium]|nr:Mov34/MPN/PAD-1 family protein [Acidobacteriota bacterium]